MRWNYLSTPNFNGCSIEVWKWKNDCIPHFADYWKHASKRSPSCFLLNLTQISSGCSHCTSTPRWFTWKSVYCVDLSSGSVKRYMHEGVARLCYMHYDDVIMDSIASQITSLMIVYSTVHSGTDQRKHQSSASLAFVWEIHRWPVNFPHKWPVTRKMFPFDDVIMSWLCSKQTDTSRTMAIGLSFSVDFGLILNDKVLVVLQTWKCENIFNEIC